MRLLLCAALMGFSLNAVADEADQPLANFKPSLDAEMKAMIQSATKEQGWEVFDRKCSQCHDHQKSGGHSKGPHLWNVFGRQAGTIAGFNFSQAMSGSGHRWDWATLNYFITRTDVAVPGRKMNFRGLKDDEERARLLVFLSSLNDNPPAKPE